MRKIFNEKTLGEEIKKKWGEYGAHYEVYMDLLKRLKELEKVKIINPFKN